MPRRSPKRPIAETGPAVRQELDRTQNSVQQAMNEVHDEKLSQLGEPRGLAPRYQILTSVVDRHFSADRCWSCCINRICLTTFQRKLATMPEFDLPVLAQIKKSLDEVRPLVDTDESDPAEVGEENQRNHHAPRRCDCHPHALALRCALRFSPLVAPLLACSARSSLLQVAASRLGR